MEILCLTFRRNCLTGFHSSSTALYSHQQCRQAPVFPHLYFISRFKYCSHPSGCKVVLRCCFHLHSPMIGYVEQLFKNILTICILSSFSKIYVDLFTFVGGCMHINVCIVHAYRYTEAWRRY